MIERSLCYHRMRESLRDHAVCLWLLDDNGIDPRNVAVSPEPTILTIEGQGDFLRYTRFLRNDEGKHYLITPDEIATEEIQVPLRVPFPRLIEWSEVECSTESHKHRFITHAFKMPIHPRTPAKNSENPEP